MRKVLMLVLLSLLLVACGDVENEVDAESNGSNELEIDQEAYNEVFNKETTPEVEEIEYSEAEEMLRDILSLIDEGLAFDTGSYIKGDVPEGEYAFVSLSSGGAYYSEEDTSGNIIDNQNFDSFGYVKVHEKGNIKTNGVLVSVDSLEGLDVSGAKELYEILNELEDYDESGYYKVGTDIEAGEYVVESYGSGYVAVMSGPVGNSNIINNQNFEGRYSVNVNEGDYLKLSRAYISE